MIVKNVGKSVIGNENFMLLPEGTQEVTGKEAWVKRNIAAGKLKEVNLEAIEGDAEEEEAKAEAEALKAAKALKAERNKILKSGTDAEVVALAAEFGIEAAGHSREELAELIKKAM